MKILLTARRFQAPLMGGVDVYADRLGRALAALGHEVTFVGFDDAAHELGPEVETALELHEGFPVWRLRFSGRHRPAGAFELNHDPQMAGVMQDILLEERPDLLVVLNFYLLTLSVMDTATLLGVPVVHIATDFVPICRRATFIQWDGQSCRTGESLKDCTRCFLAPRPGGKAVVRLLEQLPDETLSGLAARGMQAGRINPLRALRPVWRQVDWMSRRLQTIQPLRDRVGLVLAPTRYTAAMFASNGFRPESVHLMPFGVEPDHPLASVEHEPAGHVRFLFVGRIQPYKGLHLLVQAFTELADPRGATLAIYGASDGYDNYMQQIRQLAAGNQRIHFAGTVAPSELAQAFGAADVFVLPSTWHENSPLILLDSVQSSTPVLASDIGGVRDVVQHQQNGWLFPMGDAAALRAQMQALIDDPQQIEQVRASMRLPTIEEYARQMLDLCAQRLGVPRPVAQRKPARAAGG